jgi:hypothetical protein
MFTSSMDATKYAMRLALFPGYVRKICSQTAFWVTRLDTPMKKHFLRTDFARDFSAKMVPSSLHSRFYNLSPDSGRDEVEIDR